MITITINNNKCHITNIGIPVLKKLRKEPLLCIRVPGAFFSPAFKKRVWDGKFYFLNERGIFDTGKLPQVIQYLESYGKEVKLVDDRKGFKPLYSVHRLKEFTLRDYQYKAQLSVLRNKVKGLYFPIGFIKAATNAGKTLIASAIHRAYSKKTLFIINSKDLLQEALREVPKYLPDKVGYLTADGIEWNDLMIVMVKTLYNRINNPGIVNKLKEYDVCIVDEADLSTSTTYTTVLKYLFHCYVRIGLSGTQFTKLAKDKLKREKIRAIFGENIFEITNKELIEKGHSSKVEVTIVDGNLEVMGRKGYWKEEYDEGITRNNKRHERVFQRVDYHLSEGRTPMLVFAQYHEHVKNIYHYLLHKYDDGVGGVTIDWIHNERKNRNDVVERFRVGKIDILVGSMVLKRGKNFPLTKFILNAGGGDSFTNVLQGPIGRAVRKHSSKDVTYIEDMFDQGLYLKRHSKHRRIAYKNEGFKVRDRFTI